MLRRKNMPRRLYQIETLRGTYTTYDWVQVCIDSKTSENNRYVCFIDEEEQPQMIEWADINIITETEE